MPDDLTRLEQWVQPLIEKLGPAERRRLTLALAREMLAAQRTTMAAQTAPDGTPWQPRKKQKKAAKPIRYVYRKKNGEVRELEMSSYQRSNGRIVGFDKEAGGIRTMLGGGVIRSIAPRHGSGGIKARLRKTNMMMRGLTKPRWLKTAGTNENQAVVGFVGMAARIAALHQYGGPDQVEPGGPTYDYPARPLIGIPDALAERLRERLLDHLAT